MLQTKSTDLALLFLRLTFGGLMILNHGWGKLERLLSADPIKFGDPLGLGAPLSLGLATFAEFLCALFVIIGFLTKWAVIPLIITMLVAIFLVHFDDGIKKMEMAILYLTAFTAIGLAGPGWYSIDSRFRKP